MKKRIARGSDTPYDTLIEIDKAIGCIWAHHNDPGMQVAALIFIQRQLSELLAHLNIKVTSFEEATTARGAY